MPQLETHGTETFPVIICGCMYYVTGKQHIKILLRHHGLDETQWRSYKLTPLWHWL